MSKADARTDTRLHDALIAARLISIDPGLGGMILRGGADLRTDVISELHSGLSESAPMRRMPANIDDERLLGGLDLGATLAAHRPISYKGLLAEVDGGLLVIPMAERLSRSLTGRLTTVLDTGEVCADREGLALRTETRFVVVALDDGVEVEECAPVALAERLAFWMDLSASRSHDSASTDEAFGDAPDGKHARANGSGRDSDGGTTTSHVLEGFVGAAAALGIESMRAPLFALRAARAAARLAGRSAMEDKDVALAARLVLGPRARRLPVEADAPQSDGPPPTSENDKPEEDCGAQLPIEDLMIAAALASIPKDVLAGLSAGRSRQQSRASGAGERRGSPTQGRPMSARAGLPGRGSRLSLIDTLRAAAPWQNLRGATTSVKIRRQDLRIRRFETRAETLTIFAVDASGSAALARLAEAKGAIELLLAEAYIKRTEVALVAFRGVSAELLLPPTRSLTRARRLLAELPGGGGTPLAAGMIAARALAESARSRGKTPFLVILTDGRANVAADGSMGRVAAAADAIVAAQAIGAADIRSAFIDISARPRPDGAKLSAAMGARYLPLPHADAATMHAAVGAARRR